MSLGFRVLGLGFGAGFWDPFRGHTGGLWGFDIYIYRFGFHGLRVVELRVRFLGVRILARMLVYVSCQSVPA